MKKLSGVFEEITGCRRNAFATARVLMSVPVLNRGCTGTSEAEGIRT